MTPEELAAAANRSDEAMTALAHIARHGGTGGMAYVMTSAEDVPGLLDHIEAQEAKVANLGHALNVVQLREIRQDETIARLEAALHDQGHRADPAESRCPQRCKACAALREPTTTPDAAATELPECCGHLAGTTRHCAVCGGFWADGEPYRACPYTCTHSKPCEGTELRPWHRHEHWHIGAGDCTWSTKAAAENPHARCAHAEPHHPHRWGQPAHWCDGKQAGS